jgi:hypothetical protein
MDVLRAIIAFPFVLVGVVCLKLGELIGGRPLI